MSIFTALVGIFLLLAALFFAFGTGIDVERKETPVAPFLTAFILAILASVFLLAR